MTTMGDECGRGAARGTGHGEASGRPRATVAEAAQADLRGGGDALGPLHAPIARHDPPAAGDAGPTEAATTVSGRLGSWDEAEVLRRTLLDEGFSPVDIEVFYTGPAGRHGVTAIGGDSGSDAGATHMGRAPRRADSPVPPQA